MPISVTCSACGKNLRAPDEMAGRSARCHCGQIIAIPTAGDGGKVFDRLIQEAQQMPATQAPTAPAGWAGTIPYGQPSGEGPAFPSFGAAHGTYNPYAAPTAVGSASHAPAQRLPLFCLIMFIIDLALSVIRAPLVLLSLIGSVAIPADDPLRPTVWGEILSGTGMVLFGIVGNILLLCRMRIGLILGAIGLSFFFVSLGVSVWQASLIFGNPNAVPAGMDPNVFLTTQIGGFVCVGGIRAIIHVFYAVALYKFFGWSNRRARYAAGS